MALMPKSCAIEGQSELGLAHVVAYEFTVGPVPDGLDLDHMCHNADPTCPGGRACLHRRCCNPGHLLPSTRSENMTRASERRKMARYGPE